MRRTPVVMPALTALALLTTACATTPPPSLTPPPAKKLDAKTQLESGRKM